MNLKCPGNGETGIMNTPPAAESSEGEKVAVICIHGVADQPRFKTSEHFALGISDFHQTAELESAQFSVEYLRIHNHLNCFGGDQPKSVEIAAESAKPERAFNPEIDVYSSKDLLTKSRELTWKGGDEADAIRAASRVNTYFTAKKLQEFEPREKDRVYETNMIRTRVGGKTTDFYEVHWADLSRVSNSVMQILVSFYRLIFILCRLSNNVRDFGRQNFDQMRGGDWFCRLNYASTCCLALIIPGLNLALLATLVVLIPGIMGYDDNSLVRKLISSAVFAMALLGLAYGVRVWWRGAVTDWSRMLQSRDYLSKFWMGSIVFLIVAAAYYFFFASRAETGIRIYAHLVAWYLIYTVGIWLFGLYLNKELGEKFASTSFAACGLLLILIQTILLFGTDLGKTVECQEASAHLGFIFTMLTIQVVLCGLFLIWSFWAMISLVTLVWSILVRVHWRARRAAWTTQIANTGSGMLLSIATLCIWYALATNFPYLSKITLCDDAVSRVVAAPGWVGHDSPLIIQPLDPFFEDWKKGLPDEERPKAGDSTVRVSVDFLTALSSSSMVFVFASMFLLLVVSAISLRNAVSAEIPNPLVHPFGIAQKGNSTYDAKVSRLLGTSLSGAFAVIGKYAQWLFALALVGLMITPVCLVYGTQVVTTLSQMCIAAATLLFIAILTQQLPYGHVLARILDVASDVVNWLRLSPLRQNVSSKIYARYDGLLKHVSQQGYTKVVILAHSLGSLITVDLLRYWKYVDDGGARRDGSRTPEIPALLTASGDGPKVELVTFGCPLNQLLGLRFTTLYGWCRSERDSSASGPQWPHEELVCDPGELLGIRQWTNVYTSGDYVGRHIWHDNANETSPNTKIWQPADDLREKEVHQEGQRREFCLGPGAHVHYANYIPPATNNFREWVRSLI